MNQVQPGRLLQGLSDALGIAHLTAKHKLIDLIEDTRLVADACVEESGG
jgi:hypothetical protein